MKTLLQGIVLTCCGPLVLGACTCPQKNNYTLEPYTQERTAGSGVAIYNSTCAKEAVMESKPKKAIIKDDGPMGTMAPVFKKMQTK